MQKDVFELFEKTSASAMEASRKVGELNMRTFDRLFQQQADMAAFYMDASVRAMELFTKAKGYQDLMAGQVALLRECGERCITAARDGMAFTKESVTEYSAMTQEGIKQAQEQVAEAASLTVKAAA